jgi:exodeoxyribonuclease-3
MLETWQELRSEGKELIICGDYNTAHHDIDVAKPREWSKISGFLPEEREWLNKINDMGYVDTFRHFNKEPNQYTYWDNFRNARERNMGWRIDFFYVTEGLMAKVKDAKIHMDVMGSDHCPIELELK